MVENVVTFDFDDRNGEAGDLVDANLQLRKGASLRDGALRLDGRNDYALVAADAGLAVESGEIAFTFNADKVHGNRTIMSRDSKNFDGGGHLTIWIDDGRLKVRLQSDSESFTLETDAHAIRAHRDYDVVFGFGEDGMSLSINGEVVDTNAYTGGLTGNNEPLTLGASQMYSSDGAANHLRDYFDGEIKGFRMTQDTQSNCAATETLLHEDFNNIHDPEDSADVVGHTNWDVKNGALFTNGHEDGAIEFSPVQLGGHVAGAFSFDIKADCVDNFEASGQYADNLKVQLRVDGGHWITIDTLRRDGHSDEFVGDQSGFRFGDDGFTTLTYLNENLPGGSESVQFRLVSHITAGNEILRIDNVKITADKDKCDDCPEDAMKIDFNDLAKGTIVSDQYEHVTITAFANGGGKDIHIEAEDFHYKSDGVAHGNHASGGELVKFGTHGVIETPFTGHSGKYEISVFIQDETDGAGTVKVFIDGHEVGSFVVEGKEAESGNTSGSNHAKFSKFTLPGNFHIGEHDKVKIVFEDSHGSEFGRIDKVSFKAGAPLDNRAMIFDTDHITGGDHDLAAGDGKVLIISEDGDSHDPDDNAGGGAFHFDFDEGVTVDVSSIVVVDTEEGGKVEAFGANGASLGVVDLPRIPDGAVRTVDLDFEGAAKLVVTLNGSGAIDDLCYEKTAEPVIEKVSVAECDTFVIDLDCAKVLNPDSGLDICVLTDDESNQFGEKTDKPSAYTLTLGDLSTDLVSSATGDALDKVNDKVDPNVEGLFNPAADDGDGVFFVVVSKEDDASKALEAVSNGEAFFSGDVAQGDSFEAAGDFGSETFVHIFASQGGPLIQGINFHTSCSSPLIIGDQYGSISLTGATLEGKDSGMTYQVGGSGSDGDAGIVYEITGGADANLFEVDPETGEVSFKDAAEFDPDGANMYAVEITAFFVDGQGVKTGVCEIKPLEVCVEDDPQMEPICVEEETTFVVDLDLKVVCPKEVPGGDFGLDICVLTDDESNQFGEKTDKPSAYTLTLGDLSTDLVSRATGDALDKVNDKVDPNVEGLFNPAADDGDGVFFVVVSKEDDASKALEAVSNGEAFFSGDVAQGDSFEAAGDFGSETFVHIFASQGGPLIQGINFHTSCSSPLIIGDQYGSISLTGATLEGKDSGMTYQVGGSTTILEELGEGDIVYSIVGGADADLFEVDASTGEVSFKEAPDFENPPADKGAFAGNGIYQVIVRATAIDDPSCFTNKIVKVKLEDVVETGAISGRYFCDTNDNDVDDGQNVDPGEPGVLVTLLDASGNPVLDASGQPVTTFTGAQGEYRFGDLPAGTYGVRFTDPNGVLAGKQLVAANVGGDDAVDSDAIGDSASSTITGIEVVSGQDTPDNDAGVEELPGSLSGRYFCDTDDDSQDNGNGDEPAVEGVLVTLLNANGDPVLDANGQPVTAVTDANGEYSFGGLRPGVYGVRFTDPDGVLVGKRLVDANVGPDTSDSDAIGDTVSSNITGIQVVSGQDTPDNDAGVEELPGSLLGRYFCDTNDNDVDDGQNVDPGEPGVLVTLLDASGNPVLDASGQPVTTFTGAQGEYRFGDLPAGTYGVRFTDPNGVLAGKQLVAANVGGDDAVDSDAIGDSASSTITGIEVISGQDTPDNDAGVEELPGSLSGRYFCDTDDDSQDNGNGDEPAVEGVLVTLLNANGDPVLDANGQPVTAVMDANGEYSFGGLRPGVYGVRFTDPDGVLVGKRLVDANVGPDASDSDAIGDTVSSTITGIQVVSGQDTPDNDAGVEELPGSLSGRYFCDTDDDSQDNGNGDEPAVEGVLVTLLNANGDPVLDANGQPVTAVTDANGEYSFGGLRPGVYGVRFTDPDGVLVGKRLVDANVGPDASDSDAIGDTVSSTITGIQVVSGQDTPDNDAGVEEPNTPPVAADAAAMLCVGREGVVNGQGALRAPTIVDLTASVSDADGDALTIENIFVDNNGDGDFDDLDEFAGVGQTIVTAQDLAVTLNADGTVALDGTDAAPDLLIRDTRADAFQYTASDGIDTATGAVNVTLKGDLNTLETVEEGLPTDALTFVLTNVANDAFGVTLGSSDERFDGLVIEDVYCLSINEPFLTGVSLTGTLTFADADSAPAGSIDQPGGPTGSGNTARDNLDLINWILNQEFDKQSSDTLGGPSEGRNYTQDEIQAAIWGLTDDNIFVGNTPPGVGTVENAIEIAVAALNNGEGFEVSEGDIVGLFLDPSQEAIDAGHAQPFIIGIRYDALLEDCLCIDDMMM